MKSNYEVPEVLALGQARNLISGMKVIDPLGMESALGPGTRVLENDIDEGDE